MRQVHGDDLCATCESASRPQRGDLGGERGQVQMRRAVVGALAERALEQHQVVRTTQLLVRERRRVGGVQEPGIARFDVVQQADDPTRFVLVEAYRTVEATAAHKATAHYARWRDAVADMMAAPRTSVKYANVHPEDAGW